MKHFDKILHFGGSLVLALVLGAISPMLVPFALAIGAGKELYDYKYKGADKASMIWDFYADGAGAMVGFLIIALLIL